MKLVKKMLNVMAACRILSYDSENEEVGYKYVSAAKINAEVNQSLVDNGIVCVSESKLLENKALEINGNTENLATVEVTLTLIDADNDERIKIVGIGQGIDAGDKAVAKAQTMAVKYAWKNSLLIADTSDDPDANTNTKAYANKSRRKIDNNAKNYGYSTTDKIVPF